MAAQPRQQMSRKERRQQMADRMVDHAMSELQSVFRDWLQRPVGWWLSAELMTADVRTAVMPVLDKRIKNEVENHLLAIRQLRRGWDLTRKANKTLRGRMARMRSKIRQLKTDRGKDNGQPSAQQWQELQRRADILHKRLRQYESARTVNRALRGLQGGLDALKKKLEKGRKIDAEPVGGAGAQ